MRRRIIGLLAVLVAVVFSPAVAAADPIAAPPYVDHVEWAQAGGLSSLRVYPTPAGRQVAGQLNNDVGGDEAWSEVLALAPDADLPGMRDQFLCHWHYAEIVQPGKTSWNLEPWRPVVDEKAMIDAGCNPGGTEESFVTRWDRDAVARMVDHTLLKPEAGEADVRSLVEEAAALGAYAVCVSPSMVPAATRVEAPGVVVATVVGFPSGKHVSEIKAREAVLAVAAGAEEVDMVIDVGAAVAGDVDGVAADVAAVRAAVPDSVLKVIVESAALLDLAGEQMLISVCRAAADAGADFVKTSTGFHPAGGASVRAVELMAGAVGPKVGVKASGGIRTATDAVAMLDAGATRLGLSGTRAVLDGLDRAGG